MVQHNHQTALTQFVEAKGIRFAYRRFGKRGEMPLVFNQHFRGTMDHWDPAVTDGLAKNRELILLNNAGISSSSGRVPTTIQEMGANAIAFIKALHPAAEPAERAADPLPGRKSRIVLPVPGTLRVASYGPMSIRPATGVPDGKE